MPNHTTKLNLYEIDKANDVFNTFDLDTVLNENWEKIDENVINKNGTVALVAEQIGVDPTHAQGLATKNYVDTNLALKADLNGNTAEKFNVADAVQSTEAINKGQLDSATSTINTTITALDTEVTTELATKLDVSDTTVTKQGNSFNSAGELVQLNSSGQLPALDGSLLTGISPTLSTADMPTIANNTTNLNNAIDFSNGFCWDITLSSKIISSAKTKLLNAVFEEGTNAGGLDNGTKTASTWYYCFSISKSDGTSDFLFSTSKTTPVMPTGYTYKRRIGCIKTDTNNNIIVFKQDGDKFNIPIKAELYEGSYVAAKTELILSYIPPLSKGIYWDGMLQINRLNGETVNSNLSIYNDTTLDWLSTSICNCSSGISTYASSFKDIIVNNATIYYHTLYATNNTLYFIFTTGWTDRRNS